MIRISKKEFYYALQNMKHAGLDIDSFGGAICGSYSYWVEGEKIMHNQIEYEEYYEIKEEYLKYTEFDIANCAKELTDIQIKKIELGQKERELESWFYSKYYHIEKTPSGHYDLLLEVKHEGKIHYVTAINFAGRFVSLEGNGQEYTVNFLEFDKLFKEWHNIKIIEWD